MDAALLSGRGHFVDDLGTRPGTFQAAILRSPMPMRRSSGSTSRPWRPRRASPVPISPATSMEKLGDQRSEEKGAGIGHE